jgi:hypothetical protein
MFNNSDATKSWRLIYTNNLVLELFESEGVTSTIYNLFTSTSYQDCLNHIQSLNLIFNTEESNENNS